MGTSFYGIPELSTDLFSGLIEERSLDRLKELGGTAGIADGLGVNIATGQKRSDMKALYGPNVLPEKKSATFVQLMWAAYQDKTLILLTVAAAFSLAIGIYEEIVIGDRGWIEGVAIMCAIIIVVLVNAANDYQRERQFRMLSAKVKDRKVTVLVDGSPTQVSVFDVTVGDVLMFEPGEIMPADGLLINGHKVTIDESGVTGESDAVQKCPEAAPWILSGTRVIDGSGRMLVLAVGLKSSQGRLVEAMQQDAQPTPLQYKLDILADHIAKAGAAAALFMVVALLAKYISIHAVKRSFPVARVIVQHILHIVIQAVTIIVVAVPEGLPMAVTMALAYATTKMLKDNNLVRVMASCETMGAATTICSDKTGTLTENKMTVVRYRICGDSGSKDSQVSIDSPLVADSIAINSTAFRSPSSPEWIGSKTEVALLNFSIASLGQSNYVARREACKIIQRVPFSSERKCMSTAIEAFDSEGRPIGRIFLKGASEIVLSKCSQCVDRSGRVRTADGEFRTEQLKTISEYASESLRTIGLAYKDIVDTQSYADIISSGEALEHEFDFTWLGVVGIEDPLREGVTEAVRQCQQAGILVRMVTGDNVETARAIATKANILSPNGLAMEGSKFRLMTDEELKLTIPKLQVLARSSPLDKQILVKKLREYGEIVAVTGDGTNDGPALKAANVGFSMGITGTEVAKEASAIVLMDDNFTSIVKAVSWGRAVNDAVKKFLQFQLTVNLTAVISAAVSAMIDSNDESVLTAVQLLWVNLIMDTFAALSLATDPPSDDILERPPDKPTAGLVTPHMKLMIVSQSIAQISIILSLQLAGHNWIPDRLTLRSLIFNTFIFLQLFNELNCRVLGGEVNFFKGLSKNIFFPVIWIGTVLAQIVIINFGGKAFNTVPIDWKLWIVSVAIGLLSLVVGLVVRLVLYRFLATAPASSTTADVEVEHWRRAVHNVQQSRAFYNALRREHQLKTFGSVVNNQQYV